MELAVTAKDLILELQIGVNLLSTAPLEAARRAIASMVDMFWADDMGVDSTGLNELGKAAIQHGAWASKNKFFRFDRFQVPPC